MMKRPRPGNGTMTLTPQNKVKYRTTLYELMGPKAAMRAKRVGDHWRRKAAAVPPFNSKHRYFQESLFVKPLEWARVGVVLSIS